MGTIPLTFTFSLSAKHSSLPCFSKGITEIAQCLLVATERFCDSLKEQCKKAGSLCFIIGKPKQAIWAQWKTSEQMNQSNHLQADAAQDSVWICVLNDRQWMLALLSIFKSFSLYTSPARPLPKVPFLGIFVLRVGQQQEAWQWHAVNSLPSFCWQSKRSSDNSVGEQLISQCFPVCCQSRPWVPILTIPLSLLYCFVWCSYMLSFLLHPWLSNYFFLCHRSAFQGLSCKTQLMPVFSHQQ